MHSVPPASQESLAASQSSLKPSKFSRWKNKLLKPLTSCIKTPSNLHTKTKIKGFEALAKKLDASIEEKKSHLTQDDLDDIQKLFADMQAP